VASPGAKTAPAGTVTFITSDNSLGTVDLAASGQTATAALSVAGALLAVGNGTVTALYSGDAVFSASAGTAATTLQLPATGSLAVPSVTPNPVYQEDTPEGAEWPVTASLTEKAGVATTLTQFTIGGVIQSLKYWSATALPAHGTISADLYGHGLVPPVDSVFHFAGVDANGKTWSQDLTVHVLGPAARGLTPLVALASAPTPVLQDPSQDPSCQWSHELIVEEQGGFEVELVGLSTDTEDLSDNLQQLFGTTQLAPYGMLRATICRAGVGGTTDTYTLLGFAEDGSLLMPSLPVVFEGPAVNPPTFSVSPTAVNLSAPDSTHPASATLNLSFTSDTPNWAVSVLPNNRTSAWLTVSTLSGIGPAQLQLQAAAGLSKGVYQATVTIVPYGTTPQSIDVPVTFVVGASDELSVDHASNAASYAKVYAPGMIMAVFGSRLAPAPQQDFTLPLPLNMQGVSVTVNGVAAPQYYVSPTQLNIQIPYETTLGTAVLGINNNGKVTSFSFPVTVCGPGIFATLDGSLVPYSTGRQGQILLAFITGEGVLTPTLATGAAPAASTLIDLLPQPNLPV
jgi:hypothetical protein